jgi:hypothetical protein
MERSAISVVRRRSAQGRPALWLSALLLVVALATGAWWLRQQGPDPSPSRVEAPAAPADPPTPDVATTPGNDGNGTALQVPPAEAPGDGGPAASVPPAAPGPTAKSDPTPAAARAVVSRPSTARNEPAPPPRTTAAAADTVEGLEQAALKGDAAAQYRLALRLRDGDGVPVDAARALAWLMQAAAREHGPAVDARDRLYAALDDSARVRGESLSRDLGIPMPAGWLRDPGSGIAVWAPSWYRNGTWNVSIRAPARDGRAHGEGVVSLEALLYGRSSRSHEGRFIDGRMLDPATARLAPRLLATDEVRFELEVPDALRGAVSGLWMRNDLDGLRITACPDHNPSLFAAVRGSFPAIDDEAVEKLGLALMAVLNARCPLDPRGDATLSLVAETHQAIVDRGDTEYRPLLARIQLHGDGAAPDTWRVNVRANLARRAHERDQQALRKAQERAERAAQRERETAAAARRGNPSVRGMHLGMTPEAFREALGDDAVAWDPPLRPESRVSPLRSFEQSVTLADGARISATFASAQHQGRMLVMAYEQRLRNGPALDELREQLFRRYGPADRESGQGTWLTWWLNSATGAPLGAFLKGRLQTERGSARVLSLRLVLNDPPLVRQDEARAAAARREAKRAEYERSRSGEVKF